METKPEITPLLAVRGAAAAIDFYVRALNATVVARYDHGPERRVGHADLAIGDARFALTEELRALDSPAPPSLGGSPVVLQLAVSDAEAVLVSMCDAGASIVLSLGELLGERMARVRDPFGHTWLLRQRVEELSQREIQRRRDELYERFSAQLGARGEEDSTVTDARPSRQARIHLVVGPVGAGKSTYALGLVREHAAVRLTLDEWMTTLFSPDRPDDGVVPWYTERASRCIDQIWSVARQMVASGTDVVLEIGLLRRHERAAFYRRVDDTGFGMTIHVIDAPREVRRLRVEERNRMRGTTFSMVVPPAIFELASDLWEPPDVDEHEGRAVRLVHTDQQS